MVPKLDVEETLPLYAKVQEAIVRGMLQSCHSPCRGGIAVGLAKIAMGGELGVSVDLGRDPHASALSAGEAMFSESNGRYLVSVAHQDASAFEKLMAGVACSWIGEVTSEPRLSVRHAGVQPINVAIAALKASWKETLDAI